MKHAVQIMRRILQATWRGWRRVTHAVQWVVTAAVFVLVYYGFLCPTALISRLCRKRWLPITAANGTQWIATSQVTTDYRRLF